jgi:hypothetical protein
MGQLTITILMAMLGLRSLWALFLFPFIFAIVGGYLSFKFPQGTTELTTACIGAYTFMRGWSHFGGGYPSESELIESLQAGVKPQFTGIFIFYIVFCIGLWAAAFWWQHNKE